MQGMVLVLGMACITVDTANPLDERLGIRKRLGLLPAVGTSITMRQVCAITTPIPSEPLCVNCAEPR